MESGEEMTEKKEFYSGAVLFLHGLGQTPQAWEAVASGCKRLPAPAVGVDLYGLLEGREPVYEELYRGLEEFCKGIPGPLHLCGLSLGGVLALHYGISHPERISSLALFGAQYRMPKTLLSVQNAVFRLLPESAFAGMGLSKGDAIRLMDSMKDLDFSGSLTAVSCPCLVAVGEKDLANRRAAWELWNRLPNACLFRVKGSGHEVNLQAGEQAVRLLDGFYGRGRPVAS